MSVRSVLPMILFLVCCSTVPYRKTRPRSRPKFRGFRADSRRTPATGRVPLPFRRPVGRLCLCIRFVCVSKLRSRIRMPRHPSPKQPSRPRPVCGFVSLLLPPCRSPSRFCSSGSIEPAIGPCSSGAESRRRCCSLPPADRAFRPYRTRAPFTGDLDPSCGLSPWKIVCTASARGFRLLSRVQAFGLASVRLRTRRT